MTLILIRSCLQYSIQKDWHRPYGFPICHQELYHLRYSYYSTLEQLSLHSQRQHKWQDQLLYSLYYLDLQYQSRPNRALGNSLKWRCMLRRRLLPGLYSQ